MTTINQEQIETEKRLNIIRGGLQVKRINLFQADDQSKTKALELITGRVGYPDATDSLSQFAIKEYHSVTVNTCTVY